jgi:hypothetical protein
VVDEDYFLRMIAFKIQSKLLDLTSAYAISMPQAI